MTTKKQAAANKRNARKSTGPKTEESKKRASRNAFKHGVLTRAVVSPVEDVEEFVELFSALLGEFEPDTYFGQLLVKRLALLLWREQRLAEAEVKELTPAPIDVEIAAHVLVEVAEQHGVEAGREVAAQSLKQYGLIVPIERQLLVGRYQTMLTNQIRKTIEDIENEKRRFDGKMDIEFKSLPSAANEE